ncbi:MAG: sucrose phosphorylase [Bacteroidota bacterium]
MKNQVQLITYADRLSGGGLKELKSLLSGPLQGLFGGIHILPFYDPIDGSDAGFDPRDHTMVDPRIGTWEDIKTISGEVDIMADFIVNHISSDSEQFKDFLKKGDASEHAGLFLTMDKVFPDGVTEKELLKIYRPRPWLPFNMVTHADGSKRVVWTTFTHEQIDIDVNDPVGKAYLTRILETFQKHGIKMIRMDAVGYAIKVPGTTSFMIPESYDFIAELTKKAKELDIEVLVEIHSYYKRQIEVADKVDRVYDFALPPLVLNAMYESTSLNLKRWYEISPKNAITVLDTHDGIGIIDVGTVGGEPSFIPEEQVDSLVETIHEKSGGKSRKATGAAASNLDLYQVNCTFYDALGRNDRDYLLARLIQFFSPGTPQVYYVGLLAGENDMELLERTNVGRDINRHYYTHEEVMNALEKPVVQDLCNLIRFRSGHTSFDGGFEVGDTNDDVLHLKWENGEEWSEMHIDFKTRNFSITYTTNGKVKKLENSFQF